MNRSVRNTFILLIIVVFMLAFTPSYTSLNIDNLAYVVAMGIDVGESEKLNITFQFTTGSSGGESGSSSEKNPLILNSVEASSIDSAVNLMNSYMARELNLSHCKVIVFSEEIATKGISNEIYTLANNSQIRPSSNIIISKSGAKDYIENATPILENLVTKYYEIFPNSNKYTGYVYNVTLGDFFNQLVCHTCEPFAILGGVNNSSSDNTVTNISEIKSSNTTFSGQRGAENLGVAVFKDDILVGELSALETLCLSIVRGDVDSFLITIANPENENEQIDIMIYPSGHKKVKVNIINGSPYITYDSKFTGRIYSMKKDAKYLDNSVLKQISEECNRYLEETLTNYLYKTSTVFKADINTFGKYCLSNFLTTQEFEEYNWKNSYANSIFKVTINTEIESGFLITES